MNDFDPGPLERIRREPSGDRWTLVFVKELRHPRERVWRALTEPDELAAWAPYTASRDLGGPGEATLTMIDGDDRVDLAATVTEVRPPELLVYSWGEDLLRWELAPAGDGTRLTLRHTMADRDFVPKVAAGWHLCLRVAEQLLAGSPIPPIRGEDAKRFGWQDLSDAYTKELDS